MLSGYTVIVAGDSALVVHLQILHFCTYERIPPTEHIVAPEIAASLVGNIIQSADPITFHSLSSQKELEFHSAMDR